MLDPKITLLKRIREGDTKYDFKDLVIQILSDLMRSSEVTSTWSPFGFLITHLAPPESPDLLRLHIWPSEGHEKQKPDWPIHFHSWALRSWIIAGTITNELYKVTPYATDGEFVLYATRSEREISTIENTGIKAACSLVSHITYHSGESYYVAPGDYHASRAIEDNLNATIVHMWDRTKEKPNAVGLPNHDDRYTFHRRVTNQNECIRLFGMLQNMLAKE